MKITHDNLKGFYRTKKGTLMKGNHVYVVKDSCQRCGESYLMLRSRPSDFCCLSCYQTGRKRHFTEEHCRNLSIALIGNYPSEETLRKRSESMKGKMVGEKNPMFGKPVTEETKKKISDGRKGKAAGEKNHQFGKPLTEETKKKMSATLKKRYKHIMPSDRPNYIHGLSGTKGYKTMSQNKREARKKGQTPQLNENEGKRILLLYEKCACMNAIEDIYQVDHIRPISKGGMHHPDNLQILLRKLNFEKHNKYPLTDEESAKYWGIRT